MEITQEMIEFAEGQKWDDDVRQDVYVILLEKADGYMKKASVPQLMTSIYNLLVLNGFRQDTRRKELVRENIQAIEMFHGTDDVCNPLEYLDAEALFDRVRTLSPLLKKTFYGYLDGVTPDQMAEHEKVDVNTIYQRIHAIKQELHNG